MPPWSHNTFGSWTANETDIIERNSKARMELAHCRTVDEVLDYFQVSPTDGLPEDRVEKAREEYGLNGKAFKLSRRLLFYTGN